MSSCELELMLLLLGLLLKLLLRLLRGCFWLKLLQPLLTLRLLFLLPGDSASGLGLRGCVLFHARHRGASCTCRLRWEDCCGKGREELLRLMVLPHVGCEGG